MNFETGSLVSYRGRDWIVLPPLHDDALLLKPLGGSDAEIVEMSPELEEIHSSVFALPDPAGAGDARSCALLRNAVRLGLRATTGPFRSFGHIAVDPRPYQLVPLLMAMRQRVVRLLIADDVGIGKTVESLLIARELLDRGEIRRMAILCPPPLAEQWQKELEEKFHITAEVVLPSTVSRLERGLGAGTSLFERYPFTIVSLDFIKSDRHRLDFIRACPELVIVDEAHACASAAGSRGHKQRYELVKKLAEDADRHMILVTATPHSGKEDVFRSLLAFLTPELAELPADLAGRENEAARRLLARYFVQRRRGDIRAYMDTRTPFPVRKSQELTWTASREGRELFEKVLALARDNIEVREENEWYQRVRWWAALALLRAVSSSPAAAAQTLSNRAQGADEPAGSLSDLDTMGRQSVYDQDSSDETIMADSLPGADTSSEARPAGPSKSRYKTLAQLAASLKGAGDAKLHRLVPHLKQLLADGFSPVIFCRFIATADYLTEELRRLLPGCTIESVTGSLPPAEREARVQSLAGHTQRILVCTDCLSEGINLQTYFNAVVHYDLSWNPTRHEQREGRVDRFGQPMPEVRIITWWGQDNPMDGMVLDVLLRKHESIRRSLGISVPVPEDSDKLMETLMRGLLLRKTPRRDARKAPALPGVEDYLQSAGQQLTLEWEAVARQEEKRSRTLFAQATIRTEDVADCLREAEAAAGSSLTVEEFVCDACPIPGGEVRRQTRDGQTSVRLIFDEQCRSRYPGLDLPETTASFVFDLPVRPGQTLLTRTHPFVEQLASWLAETALDPGGCDRISRCGVMRTRSVATRTTLLLCRFRFQLSVSGEREQTSLAEECRALAFSGSPQNAVWLDEEAVPALFAAAPDDNISRELAAGWVAKVTADMPLLMPHVEASHRQRAEILLQMHRRVRDAARWHRVRYRVQPQGSPDILGIFIFLPVR